jgi:D-mannonate dehydratase
MAGVRLQQHPDDNGWDLAGVQRVPSFGRSVILISRV